MENLKNLLLNSSSRFQWDKIGIHSHHGIDLPISALRSKQSCGIGEFYDLLPLIDWCHNLEIDVLMLLPLNETSQQDPSPYNAISSCALHPIYLSLRNLPFLSSYPEIRDKLSQFEALNESTRIQYQDVYDRKYNWLREYFYAVKESFLRDPAFQHFMEHYQVWLEPYALFKVLKNKMNHTAWATWEKKYQAPSKPEFIELAKENEADILFYSAMQYLCFVQLSNVKNYANVKGVFLKGDIPILISPDSVDVWANPSFFDLQMAAGAPPDSFNSGGQYWGCPLFNWDAMRRFSENFEWWKTRLSYADHFYDLFRIDHIVGFFRLWGTLRNKSPKEGRYIPENSALWIPQGKEILEFITNASNMLPIGEDLGSVPMEVKDCLQSLGICGTKIMRWERKWDSFLPTSEYPPLSMTSVSTHDTETLKEWWKALPHESGSFAAFKGWHYSPEITFDQQKELLRDSHHTTSFFHINLLQEYLSLFPELVWPDFKDERINIPGTLNSFNWTYRFRLPIEEIVKHEGLKKSMYEIIN